jgi:hypothetical protein
MIQVLINPSDINNIVEKIEQKVQQAEATVSPMALTEIGKAVFTITTKAFIRDLSLAAKTDPKKYHHLYEWNEIGRPSSKLFLIKRTNVQYGKLKITFIPIKSSKPVPIKSKLLEPGTTGKSVNSHYIFKNKMEIMESNTPIHIVTKNTIVFLNKENGLVFVPKNKIINILHPGGQATTNSLRNFSEIWYNTRSETVINNSRIIKEIENCVATVLNRPNSSKIEVINSIKQTSEKYSLGIDTF